MKMFGKKYMVAFWAACFLLIGMGIVFRIFAAKIQHVPMQLQTPLATFPLEVDGWVGRDVPIPDTVLAVADNDDYLHRMYSRSEGGAPVNLYIAFTARPGRMLGHSPEVCYVGAGYLLDDRGRAELRLRDGREIPCVVNRSHQPMPDEAIAYVLHYYLLNDQIITDDRGFRGLKWRKPNFSRETGHFVAQIRFSGPNSDEVLRAAEELSDNIIHFFRQAAEAPADTAATRRGVAL